MKKYLLVILGSVVFAVSLVGCDGVAVYDDGITTSGFMAGSPFWNYSAYGMPPYYSNYWAGYGGLGGFGWDDDFGHYNWSGWHGGGYWHGENHWAHWHGGHVGGHGHH